MSTIWAIAKVVFYAWLLCVLLQQSMNFIFVFARRPVTWILVVAVLGIANMAIAYALGWSPGLVAAATFLALAFLEMNSKPRNMKSQDISPQQAKAALNQVYEAFGIRNGRLKHILGLSAFAATSIASYALLFGSSCTGHSSCQPLFKSLF